MWYRAYAYGYVVHSIMWYRAYAYGYVVHSIMWYRAKCVRHSLLSRWCAVPSILGRRS
jgi:hypothetical protein